MHSQQARDITGESIKSRAYNQGPGSSYPGTQWNASGLRRTHFNPAEPHRVKMTILTI